MDDRLLQLARRRADGKIRTAAVSGSTIETVEPPAIDEPIMQIARRRAHPVVSPHGMLGLLLEQPPGMPRVGQTIRLGVVVFDHEVAGRAAFYRKALVDVAPTIRLVDSRGIEVGLAVVRVSQGRYYAGYEVASPGMHSWTGEVSGISLTGSFQSRL